jgi:hypothetical protein
MPRATLDEVEARLALAIRNARVPEGIAAAALAEVALADTLAFACSIDGLGFARARAAAVGFSLTRVVVPGRAESEQDPLYLLDAADSGAAILIRPCGQVDRLSLEVPNARQEEGTLQSAIDLMLQLDARALFVSAIATRTLAQPFTLAIKRHWPDANTTLVVRGLAAPRCETEASFVSSASVTLGDPQPARAAALMAARLSTLGWQATVVPEDQAFSFALATASQAHLRADTQALTVWLSWSLRQTAKQARRVNADVALGLWPSWRGTLAAFATSGGKRQTGGGKASCLDALVDLALAYRRSGDPGLLREIERQATRQNGRVAVWLQKDHGEHLLIRVPCAGQDGIAVVSLARHRGATVIRRDDVKAVTEYFDTGAEALLIRASPGGRR